MRRLVASLGKRFDREPIDSKLLLRNLEPYITKGEPGKMLDRTGALGTILRALRENRRTDITLPVRGRRPDDHLAPPSAP